jgi:hypothetical protein
VIGLITISSDQLEYSVNKKMLADGFAVAFDKNKGHKK